LSRGVAPACFAIALGRRFLFTSARVLQQDIPTYSALWKQGATMHFKPLLRACFFAFCFAAAFMAVLKLMQSILTDSRHEATNFP
jgi:hypothetical protein